MTTQVKTSTRSPPTLPPEVWTDWLDDYGKYVEPTTDGALKGIFAGGSIELGLAIGRQVGVHYGRPTYANLFVALCGPTGVPRKTTVLSRGQDIRQAVFSDDFIRVSRSIGSGEGLLAYFCKEQRRGGRVVFGPVPGQRVLLDEPELTNLLKKSRRSGTANIPEILLVLYDGDDWSPKTRSRPILVQQPFFCLMATTTPDSLELSLEDVDIDSGLTPRFATFWCTPRTPMAYPPVPDAALAEALAGDLGEISDFAAEVGMTQSIITLSNSARAEWEAAYQEFTAETRNEPKAVAAIMARVPLTVMKWWWALF